MADAFVSAASKDRAAAEQPGKKMRADGERTEIRQDGRLVGVHKRVFGRSKTISPLNETLTAFHLTAAANAGGSETPSIL